MIQACRYGYKEIVKILYEHNAIINPNVHNDDLDDTPLFSAVSRGNDEIVDQLIEYRADVNAVLKNGETPCYVAAKYGRYEIIKKLIDAKANVNAQLEVCILLYSFTCFLGWIYAS